MKLGFFGRLRDAVGDELMLDLPPEVATTDDLRAFLGPQHPALLDPTVKIALDDQILVASAPLAGAREIAFLPPVSGG
jgi:sulfur-carrier protein